MKSATLLLFVIGAEALTTVPTGRGTFDPIGLTGSAKNVPRAGLVASAAAALAVVPDDSVAKGGEYGLAEGRIISMLHPTLMAACFGTSIFAGYTGYQWRRLREVGAELSAAKKVAKAKAQAIEALDEEADSSALQAAKTEADALVESLTVESKELRSANSRDVHYTLGTVLLAIGIPFAIEGPVNTYMRAGKLFPGPHLYAGAICVSLWGLAAALVPEMQKGKDWARSAHIALNAINVALFGYYQIPTGLEIAGKVIANTKFP